MKSKHANIKGWMLVSCDKSVHTYEPENRLSRVLRFMPLWLTLIILSVKFHAVPAALALTLPLLAILGLVLTRREFYPSFFATPKRCGFGVKMSFRTRDAVLLTAAETPLKVIVLNGRNGMCLPIWDASDEAERELVCASLARFITARGVIEPQCRIPSPQ